MKITIILINIYIKWYYKRNLSYKDINNEEPPSNAKYYFENGNENSH